MLPKIFSAITKNLKRLGAQLTFVAHLHDERARNGQPLPSHFPRISTLRRKIRLFQYLKVSLFPILMHDTSYLTPATLQATVGLYLSSFLILSLLKMVMPWRLHWVNNLLQESSSVIVIGVIIYLLSPDSKLFSRYILLIDHV